LPQSVLQGHAPGRFVKEPTVMIAHLYRSSCEPVEISGAIAVWSRSGESRRPEPRSHRTLCCGRPEQRFGIGKVDGWSPYPISDQANGSVEFGFNFERWKSVEEHMAVGVRSDVHEASRVYIS
jgi:hypothetical protein